jgi:hypothetical protein
MSTKTKLLDLAKKRFKLCQEAEQKQREREKEDLRFQVAEEQWSEDAKRERSGIAARDVPTPPRPMISVPKLDQPFRLISNQQRLAHLSVQIQPLSPEANIETAAVFEGLFRRIQRDSNATQVRTWAFDRAVLCGRGWYRITTEWDDEGEDLYDQCIRIRRILHQESVYMDPGAQEQDFSDAEFAFVTSWVPVETFKREFPKVDLFARHMNWEDLVVSEPDWVRGETEEVGAILVAEYFYKEHELEDVPIPNDKKGRPKRKGTPRKKDKITLQWCKFYGDDVLEEAELNGKWIPLVPVIGHELQPYDDQRRFVGMIGPAKDVQRAYNFGISGVVEAIALETKPMWLVYAEQIEGYESWWQQQNLRNFPYLPHKPIRGANNELLPAPQRIQVDGSKMQAAMALVGQMDQAIQAATATFSPSLGAVSTEQRSGRAILALQNQGDAGTSDYVSNLADISMMYEATVILDLVPEVYDRPGRIARILTEEGESDMILLNQPFYHDQNKVPMPLKPGQQPPPMPGPPVPMGPPAGAPSGMGPMPSGPPMPPAGGPPVPPPIIPKIKFFDLRKGVYSVAVSVGKSRQTALEEGDEAIAQVLQAQPNLMTLLGPLWLKYKQTPWAREMADLLGKYRDMTFPGLKADDENMPTPQQMQGQITQMGQQLQMLTAQLQAAVQKIQTEEVKQQAVLAKAQMDNETKLQIAQLEANSKAMLERLYAEFETLKTMLQHGHEAKESALDRVHDVVTTAQGQAHAAAMGAAGAAAKPPDLTYRAPSSVPIEPPSSEV